MNDSLGTAYHEAGHVVALVVLEYPFESVTVLPDSDRLVALTALHAGLVAEARFLDVEFEEVWNSRYSFPDQVDAIRIARAMEDARQLTWELFTSMARSRAVDLVDMHSRAIEAMVPSLLARGTLAKRRSAR